MAYLSSLDAPSRQVPNASRQAKSLWLPILYSAATMAFLAGALAGRDAGSAVGTDSQLLTLLRFMAALKLGVAVGAVALTHWRLKYQVAPGLAASYVTTVTIMVAAPGLIWNPGTLALGALVFHLGLFSFLLLAKLDDGGRHALIASAVARRRREQQTEL